MMTYSVQVSLYDDDVLIILNIYYTHDFVIKKLKFCALKIPQRILRKN